MQDQIKLDITIPFASKRLAEIAYDVLRVDAEPKRSKVTKLLSVKENILEVTFSGETARQVRVATTGFFDNLVLILETMDFTGAPVSESYGPF